MFKDDAIDVWSQYQWLQLLGLTETRDVIFADLKPGEYVIDQIFAKRTI